MKKLNLIVVLSLMTTLLSGKLSAQHLEVSGYYGFMYGGGFDAYFDNSYQDAKITSGGIYGATIGVAIPSAGVLPEFCYQRLDSELKSKSPGGLTEYYGNFTSEYFLLNINKYSDITEELNGYAGLALGAARFNSERYNEEYWNFAVGFQAGLKYFVSDHIGIKLQVGMKMPVQYAGVGIGIGTGGASAGVGVSSTMIQGDFMGGIVFRLGN